MRFGPLRRPPQKKHFIAWDTETLPPDSTGTIKPFLICAKSETEEVSFQGEPGDIYERFVEWIFKATQDNDNIYVCSHNGGGFDHQPLISHLVTGERAGRYVVQPVLSGPASIVLLIRRKSDSQRLVFYDSVRLIPESLKKIGQTLGIAQKGEMPKGTPTDSPLWVEYCLQDCRVLYEALVSMDTAIRELGGELKATAAGTAMDTFKRRFLKTELFQCDYEREFIKKASNGGRTEVFDLNRWEDVGYFDVNSLYPAAYRYPMPTTQKKVTNGNEGLADFDRAMVEDDWIGFVEAEVHVPDGLYVPPLPFRTADKLIFPTGLLRRVWDTFDLRNAIRAGCDVRAIGHAVWFEGTYLLREYAEVLYDARKNSPIPAVRLAAKLLLNSLFGKFGQRMERENLIFYPDDEDLPIDEDGAEWNVINPDFDLWKRVNLKRENHMLPHISAHVLAVSKWITYPDLLRSHPIYTDTDSIVTRMDLGDSNELGKFKKEAHFEWFQAYAPKLYHGVDTKGKLADKAKGFGGWSRESFDGGTVAHLASGGGVHVRGPSKFKSMMERQAEFHERDILKFASMKYTKRFVNPDRTTRPLRVVNGEVEEQ